MSPTAKFIAWTVGVFAVCWGAAGMAIWSSNRDQPPLVAAAAKAGQVRDSEPIDLVSLWEEIQSNLDASKEKYQGRRAVVRCIVDSVGYYEQEIADGVVVYLKHQTGADSVLRRQNKIIVCFLGSPKHDQGFDLRVNRGYGVPFRAGDTITLSAEVHIVDQPNSWLISLRDPKLIAH